MATLNQYFFVKKKFSFKNKKNKSEPEIFPATTIPIAMLNENAMAIDIDGVEL